VSANIKVCEKGFERQFKAFFLLCSSYGGMDTPSNKQKKGSESPLRLIESIILIVGCFVNLLPIAFHPYIVPPPSYLSPFRSVIFPFT